MDLQKRRVLEFKIRDAAAALEAALVEAQELVPTEDVGHMEFFALEHAVDTANTARTMIGDMTTAMEGQAHG